MMTGGLVTLKLWDNRGVSSDGVGDFRVRSRYSDVAA